MTTFPPAAAICFAVAAPTPEEEPVTMAMVCSNFIVTLLPVMTVDVLLLKLDLLHTLGTCWPEFKRLQNALGLFSKWLTEPSLCERAVHVS